MTGAFRNELQGKHRVRLGWRRLPSVLAALPPRLHSPRRRPDTEPAGMLRSQQLTKVAPKQSPAPVGSTSSTSNPGCVRRVARSK